MVAIFIALLSATHPARPLLETEIKLPDALETRLDHLVKNYPTGFAVRIDDITQNETIFAGNQNTPLNPASVMKLISTKAAIDILGLGFRWETEVLINWNNR
jgi:D-alanyl-D-alanine carboxypeptidase/D-alanyl-D-alanine-endopeptidase (penicillin-binding protein 4)